MSNDTDTLTIERQETATWGRFAREAPELARFGAARLVVPPAYLATVRPDGTPRVHPVTPILTDDRLLVFMEPTSPKGQDLRVNPWFALHNDVPWPDPDHAGGEVLVTGTAVLVEDPAIRAEAVEAASYEPADRYILFELRPAEVRAKVYGDTGPQPRRWTCSAGS